MVSHEQKIAVWMASFPILNDFGVGAKCRSTQAAGINTSSGMKRAWSGNTIRKGMGLDPIFIALPLAMSLSSGQDTGKPKATQASDNSNCAGVQKLMVMMTASLVLLT